MAQKTYEMIDPRGQLVGHAIECPACKTAHWFEQSRWTFNGDLERPTFEPSIRVRSENSAGPTCCHSFVRNGRIEFLSDCTHELAGQTVDLPDVDI